MAVRRLALFTPLVYLAFASCVDHPLSPRPPGLRAASVLDTVGAAVLVGAGDIGDCTKIWDSLTANLLDTIPGTVFAAGDNAYEDGTPAEYANCYGPTWGRFKARTRPVPGNHDYNTPGAAGYFGYFGAAAGDPAKGYYSYDLGAWHIIALNSNIAMDVGSAQEQWLRADLAAHPTVCTLAYWHHPLFSSSTVAVQDAAQAAWRDLYDAGAELVINGHHHDYERFAPQTPTGVVDTVHGIREIVVGTGGGEGLFPFATTAPHSEVRNNETFGVLKLTLGLIGYEWKFIPIEGPQFSSFTDSGSGTCHGPPGILLPQTISFAHLQDRTFGDGPVSVSGTASSGLPLNYTVTSGANCTIAGDTVTITGPGSCSVTATQAGDSTYAAAAPVTQTFAIAKATPALAWSPPTTMVYGSPLSIAQLAATASGVNHTGLAGAFTYAPASDTILGQGSRSVALVLDRGRHERSDRRALQHGGGTHFAATDRPPARHDTGVPDRQHYAGEVPALLPGRRDSGDHGHGHDSVHSRRGADRRGCRSGFAKAAGRVPGRRAVHLQPQHRELEGGSTPDHRYPR